jgi:hypothetical protein
MLNRFPNINTQTYSKGSTMLNSNIPLNRKIFWRKKAQTNIYMAKELADIYGGGMAIYLKKLNHRLKIKIADDYNFYSRTLARAA